MKIIFISLNIYYSRLINNFSNVVKEKRLSKDEMFMKTKIDELKR